MGRQETRSGTESEANTTPRAARNRFGGGVTRNRFVLTAVMLVAIALLAGGVGVTVADTASESDDEVDALWEIDLDVMDVAGTTYHDGTVYASGGNTVYAIDATTGEERWNVSVLLDVDRAPAVADGTVYFGSDRGTWTGIEDVYFYAVDAETGEEEWSTNIGANVRTSPAVDDGVVYFGSWDNDLHALDADTGDELWTYSTGRNVNSDPAVVDGVVYFASNDENIYAVDATSGQGLWSYEMDYDPASRSVAVADGTVYLTDYSGVLHAVDAEDGSEEWTVERGWYPTEPATGEGLVVVAGRNDPITAFDAETGEEMWSRSSERDTSQFVHDGTVYVGDWDEPIVRGLDAGSGDTVWTFDTGGWGAVPHAIADDVLYASSDGTLHAVPTDPRAELEVVDVTLSDTDVRADEAVTVTVDVENTGTLPGEHVVPLEIDGERVNTTLATVDPGETETVSFSVEFDDAGTYDVAAGGLEAGTVTVTDAEPKLEVSQPTIFTDVTQGAVMNFGVTVENTDSYTGEEIPVTVEVFDEVQVDETIDELAPGEDEYFLVEVDTATVESGEYEWRVEAGEAEPLSDSFTLHPLDLEVSQPTIFTDVTQGAVMNFGVTVENVDSYTGEEIPVVVEVFDEVQVDEEIAELSPDEDEYFLVEVDTATIDPGEYEWRVEVGEEEPLSDSFTLVPVDRPDPEIDWIWMDGHADRADTVYASEDVPVTVRAEAPFGDVDAVDLELDSLETTWTHEIEATHDDGDYWTATIDLEAVPDDGAYELAVQAVDDEGNTAETTAEEILEIDREPPELAATVGEIDGETATVTVSSDADLDEAPAILLEYPDGGSEDAFLAEDDGRWTTVVDIDGNGAYAVTAFGTDLAGNDASADATAVVYTDLTLEAGDVLENPRTGTTVEFVTNESVPDASAAISEGAFAHHPLADDQLGVTFLTADLGAGLSDRLENATIRVPVDESAMAPVDDPETVSLARYDETAGEWEPVETTVETIDDEHYWVATVDRFSTYGAIATDDRAPTIETTPEDGAELESDTDEVTVTVEYADDLTGLDPSSVSLSVDGVDVTEADGTAITSISVVHTLAVEAGSGYDLEVTVADHAGNDRTVPFSFDVASPSSGQGSGSSGGDSSIGSGAESGETGPDDDVADETDEVNEEDDSDEMSVDDEAESDDVSPEDGDDDASVSDDDEEQAVDDEADGSVTDDSDGSSADDTIPGFGLTAAIVALLGVAALAARSRS
ncbi:PQQ-binding-like beta-propeller repeat protein [Natronoglomus mannanivorans]|uniref:PQQ-binding-like beta-propeller repeat protein n=1 Tax=Natronoglomus mannanivorans TaxID=2979990 RepID=A0AAP2Z3L5_9EURY|nr:PQQ-binding-like beta-propeller repeat protein [Halobacteria archaeon AArc-xg1-1]